MTLTPISWFSITQLTCDEVPVPPDENTILSWLALVCAMNSLRLFGGRSFLVISISGASAMKITGWKSLAG